MHLLEPPAPKKARLSKEARYATLKEFCLWTKVCRYYYIAVKKNEEDLESFYDDLADANFDNPKCNYRYSLDNVNLVKKSIIMKRIAEDSKNHIICEGRFYWAENFELFMDRQMTSFVLHTLAFRRDVMEPLFSKQTSKNPFFRSS